jgi:RecJ-like exonuclease
MIIFLANNLEPKIMSISSIDEKMLDNWVRIQGNVLNINKINMNNSANPLVIISLKDNSSFMDIVFRKDINLSIGQNIEVLGKVSEYNQEIQIETSKIKIIS